MDGALAEGERQLKQFQLEFLPGCPAVEPRDASVHSPEKSRPQVLRQVPPPPLPPGLTQESGLVQARVTPPDNHLLASSDGLPEAVARLFPTSGIETTPGLVSVATGALSLHQPSVGKFRRSTRRARTALWAAS